jgi:hypothetical protein
VVNDLIDFYFCHYPFPLRVRLVHELSSSSSS